MSKSYLLPALLLLSLSLLTGCPGGEASQKSASVPRQNRANQIIESAHYLETCSTPPHSGPVSDL
mgnify:CR=1 FL=1